MRTNQQTRRRLLKTACGFALGMHWSALTHAEESPDEVLENQIKGSVNGLKTLSDSEEKQLEQGELPEGFEILKPGQSSRHFKHKASKLVPVMKMTPHNQNRVSEILDHISLYRRLPSIRFRCDHDCYDYFVDHPDSAVSIWRAMELSAMQLWQTGPMEYECESNDGTLGLLDYAWRDAQTAITYSKGAFKSPFLKHSIEAKGLLCLYHEKSLSPSGEHLVTHHADVFVRFPSRAIEATARLITPVSNMIADANFREVSKFVYSMSIAMQNHPEWVEQVATRMDGILPQTRQQLLLVTASAHHRSLNQVAARPNDGFSDSM